MTPLTRCERRVLALAAHGMTDTQIAAALVWAPNSVRVRLAVIYYKLGIAHRYTPRWRRHRAIWLWMTGEALG